MNKRADQGRATRDQILAVASRLFAAEGFADVSIETVLAETGVSRGALYYHFASKEVLFEAVLEDVEARLMADIGARGRTAKDAEGALILGGEAWLEAALNPSVRQIVLIDAPAVLGWEKFRAIDARYAFGGVKRAVDALADEGRFPSAMREAFAHMLLAAMIEMALIVARASDQAGALKRGKAALRELLLRTLRAAPG